MNNNSMPTTIDNPYNPFTEWDDWWQYDHEFGHCTWEIVSRLAYVSNDLPKDINDEAIDEAIQLLIETDYELKYILVTKEFDFNKLKEQSQQARSKLFTT